MKNFCYWQEDSPQLNTQIYGLENKKICLLRLNEYRLLKESAELKLINNINIFCPLIKAEQATEMECLTGIKLNE